MRSSDHEWSVSVSHVSLLSLLLFTNFFFATWNGENHFMHLHSIDRVSTWSNKAATFLMLGLCCIVTRKNSIIFSHYFIKLISILEKNIYLLVKLYFKLCEKQWIRTSFSAPSKLFERRKQPSHSRAFHFPSWFSRLTISWFGIFCLL